MDSLSPVELLARVAQATKEEESEQGILLVLINGDNGSISLRYATDGPKAKAIAYVPSKLQSSRNCTLENCCNGLLCFSKSGGGFEQVFVCNPSLKEDITLPDIISSSSKPMPFSQKYGLGFSPCCEEYKVVRVSSDPSVQGKIYTLGTESWRDLLSVPPTPFYGKPVSANGSLYWKVDTDMCQTEDRIISFDIEEEKFYITNHPNLKRNDLIELIQFRGQLAVVDLSYNTHIDVWVMNPMMNQWDREYVLNIKPFDDNSDNRGFKVIGLWQQGQILLSWNDNSFYSYDPKTDDISYIHNIIEPSPFTIITEVSGYTKSSVSLQPYGYEEL